MARRNRNRRRVASANAKRSLPSSYRDTLPRSTVFDVKNQLFLFEDRRSFNPESIYAPARSFSKTRHRLIIPRVAKAPARGRPKQLELFPPAHIGFRAPEKVLICVRRKMRKEVMFATGKAGKAGQKKPRRNEYSEVHC